jgi:hypothetical protein
MTKKCKLQNKVLLFSAKKKETCSKLSFSVTIELIFCDTLSELIGAVIDHSNTTPPNLKDL